MADPVTLAAAGAVAGAALKPKNPLQGALLGATAGFTGGTALGVGAGSAAAGAAGGAAAGGASAAGNSLLASEIAAQPALSYAASNIAPSSVGANGAAAGGYSYGMAGAEPSFMEKIGMAGKSAFENPMMTGQALQATQGLLTQEQQAPSAPTIPVQSRKQLAAFDPMAAMNPYKQSVVGGQPISLI